MMSVKIFVLYGPEFREFFSEIWATVRCSESSVIFGRHAERSVTDEMSSFHSERLTPDNGQGRTARCGGIAKFCTVQRSRSFALRHLFVSNKISTGGCEAWLGPGDGLGRSAPGGGHAAMLQANGGVERLLKS